MITSSGRRRAGRAGLVALALGALLLAGCTSSGATSGATSAGSGGEDSAAESPSFADAGGGSGGAAAPSAAADSASFQGAVSALAADRSRQVITTGSASVVVDDPADAASRIAVLVEAAGGRVEQRAVQTPEEGPSSASLTVRVPASSLSTTVDQLGTLGTVSDVQVTATDVTAQTTDLDARIAALRTSTERLTTLLAGAGSTEQVVAAEGALTQRQAELDSLTSQRALLAGQVEMATLTLSVTERAAAPVVEAGGFLGGLASGWRGLVSAVSGLLVAAGVLLPWLVVAGLVTAAAVGVRRLVRRTRGARGTSTPAAGGGSA